MNDKEGQRVSRWCFPEMEGIFVREETGEWSDTAFFNDLLDADDQVPEVWHQARPSDGVSETNAWKRWISYLENDPSSGETLRRLALMEAKSRLSKLAARTPRPKVE